MPRPHALPRRRAIQMPEPAAPPFPRFAPEPPTRALASVNALRDDKAIFDALQAWWSFRAGRPVHQWEAFQRLLSAALQSGAEDLDGFRLPQAPED